MIVVVVVEVEEENVVDLKFVGEIFFFIMKGCDEKVVLVFVIFFVRDFLVFFCDCECFFNFLVECVEFRICEKLEYL